MARRGLSLLEIIFALGILATLLPLVLNLLPTSLLALRRSEQLQSATSLALYRVDEAQYLPRRAGVDLQEDVRLGELTYHVVREMYRVDDRRYDVAVACGSSELPPVVLRTRLRVSP